MAFNGQFLQSKGRSVSRGLERSQVAMALHLPPIDVDVATQSWPLTSKKDAPEPSIQSYSIWASKRAICYTYIYVCMCVHPLSLPGVAVGASGALPERLRALAFAEAGGRASLQRMRQPLGADVLGARPRQPAPQAPNAER